MWSWAVAVLQMFGGPVPSRGEQANDALEAYVAGGRVVPDLPPLPAIMVELLRGCLRREPGERWASMGEVAARVQAMFAAECGRPYSRSKPALPERPGVPAEFAGRRTEGGGTWRDPAEWQGVLSGALQGRVGSAERMRPPGSRQAHAVLDLIGYEETQARFEELLTRGFVAVKEPLAALCVEKAFVHQAADDLPGARRQYDRAVDLLEELQREGRRELRDALASVYNQRGGALNCKGTWRGRWLTTRATGLLETLVGGRAARVARRLASAYHHGGIALRLQRT